MQVQDYVPFFQNLLLQYYQFTLENVAYAICLAVSVWLLTAIFYSIRIGFLNRRNRTNVKALLDTQSALAAAQQQIQQLQEELAANNEQLEQIKAEADQQTQRAITLQSRISRLDSQLSESIAALTTNADLSAQFSPNADGLETEDLWQRYSAINKQLSVNLAAERKTNNELQQAYKVETAKLVEKDQQLFALQARVDSQSQQLAQLELTVEQHKTLLAQQQENAQQRILEIDAKHQADLARLTALQQQALELTQAQQQQVQLQEKLNSQSSVIAHQEEVKAVEIKAVEPQAVVFEPEPQQTHIEPETLSIQEPVISEVVVPEPAIVIAETPKKQPAKTPEKASGGVAGKLKNFFSGAKQRIDKMDGKLVGQSDITPEPDEEPIQPEQLVIEPHQAPAIEIPVSQPEVSKADDQLETAIKEVLHVPAEEHSNSFAAKSWSTDNTSLTLSGKPTPVTPAKTEPQPTNKVSDDTGKQAPSKLKNLFGKFKKK